MRLYRVDHNLYLNKKLKIMDPYLTKLIAKSFSFTYIHINVLLCKSAGTEIIMALQWHFYACNPSTSFRKMHLKIPSAKQRPSCPGGDKLTQEIVMHLPSSELGHHHPEVHMKTCVITCSAPSHFIHQCRLIVYWILGNKFQWNLNQYTILIQENYFENVLNVGNFISTSKC